MAVGARSFSNLAGKGSATVQGDIASSSARSSLSRPRIVAFRTRALVREYCVIWMKRCSERPGVAKTLATKGSAISRPLHSSADKDWFLPSRAETSDRSLIEKLGNVRL